MQLTIVKPDNLVIRDNQVLIIPLGEFALPEDFWALQWQGVNGHIEYEKSDKPNEKITELPNWITPLTSEFDRIIEEQKLKEKEDQKRMLSIRNGIARKQRELSRLTDQDPKAALKQLINQ